MLNSLAQDLSFAMEAMDREARRRQAEEEIRRLNEELKLWVIELGNQADLLDLAHDAIIVRDLDGRVIFWSRGAEETYGFTKEQVLGRVTQDFLQTQFPEALKEVERQVLEQGHWQGELTHTRSDGATLLVASRWALQRNDRGEPVAYLEINRDITERQRAELELARLNAELEQRVKERTAELEFANREMEASPILCPMTSRPHPCHPGLLPHAAARTCLSAG